MDDYPLRRKARVGDYSRVPDADHTLRPHPHIWSMAPAFVGGYSMQHAVSKTSVFACPNYASVTLSFISSPYTPPNAGDGSVILKFLPCSYAAPIVH